jgi:transcriptional regulator of acetoin/glycerol metabolism
MLLTSRDQVITEASLPAELINAQPTRQMLSADAPIQVQDLTRLELAERDALRDAIGQCNGNMTAVARHLGIAKSTVYLKLKRFGLERVADGLRSTGSA